MNNRLISSYKSSTTNKQIKNSSSNVGIVIDIILDDTHKRIEKTKSNDYSGKDTSGVGSCIIRPIRNQISPEFDLIEIAPYDPTVLDIPLIGEMVELIRVGSVDYYKRITNYNLNQGNSYENANKLIFPDTEESKNDASNYNKNAQTGISNTSGISDRDTKLGEYFQPSQINPLKLYEGDKLIQSRFGQSIRFSGYNNIKNEYAPSIIIRNRQNDISLTKLKRFDVTEEDVNRDGGIIAITSGKYELQFQPGIIDDGGSSNFKTKPSNFTKYPTKLSGLDQILINTDRLIFSSKSAEMIFYSKGNWGFISDGIMSIDNGRGGANLDFNGDVKITTNDNDIFLLGRKGNIFLNTESKNEPLARGGILVNILSKLIDELNKQVFQTPTGTTLPGPNNRGAFNKIKSELETIKSTLNYTE